MATYNEMKKKADSEQDRIELRSEKVRNMIGEMPSFFDPLGEYDLGDHIRSAGLDRLAVYLRPLKLCCKTVFLRT